MLGYRLFADIAAQRDAIDKIAREQVHSWLRSKRLDADALVEGRVTRLAPDTEGALLVRDEPDGTRRMRVRTVETRPRETWTTQLTVEVPARSGISPWLMVEVEGPRRADPPRLAGQLLHVLEGSQGSVAFGTEPHLVGVDEVDEVVAAVLDADRRSLLFVAGSDSELDLRQWREFVGKLLTKTVGLAAGYVLDQAATARFAEQLGPSHGVAPWTMRTFRPGVDLDEPSDARRHRVLSTGRMIDDNERAIATMLGRRATEVSLDAPLPARAKRVDRLFQTELNALLVGELDELAQMAPMPALTEPSAPVGVDVVESAAPPVESESATSPVSPRFSASILAAVQELLGPVEDDETAVLGLLALAQQGRQAREDRPRLARRLANYESRVESLEESVRELQDRLDDSQIEHAITAEELVTSDRRVRHLQGELSRLGAAEAAWSEPEVEQRPEGYLDLVEHLATLDRVVFTGDKDILIGLEQHDGVEAWPVKVWDIACALDDYARCVLEGVFDGDVDEYLQKQPTGFRTYSPKQHARDETSLLKGSPKFAKRRWFPVPASVDEQESVFMGAHFRIAKHGMISPRLHYHNDVRGSGKVYIGYVGPHLRSPTTN